MVLNQLYRYTPLQTSFGANMVALNGGKPEVLTLNDMLKAFIAFREEVISRRTKFLLRKARDRAHVLVGLAIAVANIDEIIRLIRQAADPQTRPRAADGAALAGRRGRGADPFDRRSAPPHQRRRHLQSFRRAGAGDSRSPAAAADGARPRRDRRRIEQDRRPRSPTISTSCRSRARIQTIVKEELAALSDEFGTPRRTEIVDGGADMEDEDLIQREDMVVTVSHSGYIKRVPLSQYRAQRRGGKGRSGMSTKDEDFVTRLFVANTHTPVLFFSSRGIVYKEKVWRLPIGNPQARGKALINLLPLTQGERITTIMPLPENEASWGELDVLFATTQGTVRRNKLSDFVQVNRNGKIAMKLDEEGDEILGVETCSEGDDVLLTAASGQCIRFPVRDVRVFAGRNSVGVRGISMAEGDRAISLAVLEHVDATAVRTCRLSPPLGRRAGAATGEDEEIALTNEEIGEETDLDDERYAFLKAHEQFVLTVTENGYGKRASSYDFRLTGRGGKGIRATDVSKTAEIGRLVATFPVGHDDQIMLVSDGGQVIRVPVDGIRIASRATKGVTIFNTADDERVVSVERISEPQGEEEVGAEIGEDGAAETGEAGEAGEGDSETPAAPAG